MSAELRVENILIQVRSLLQDNGVKLWLPPFYAEDVGSCDIELEKIGREYCQILNIPYDYCVVALHELQNNALDKIRARDDFTKTGVATLKVRVPGQEGGTQLLTQNIKLTDFGSVLQANVAKTLSLTESKIKLIGNGKVIDATKTLEEQGVKNNQQILAIILIPTAYEENENSENLYERIRKAKEDAALLSSPDNENYMHMEDQQGNAIHLPPIERQSLMIALALHEKGKSALKQDNYSEALVWLLEADDAFKNCTSNLLENVDNYALLNLDIAWCYMCLKSVTQLPDAENRLLVCEKNFKKSYGENLTRVAALKGNSENERALIMRLHLLQGVLYFHQNRRAEAEVMLNLVDSELKTLKVDENSVVLLAEMGYSVHEARLSLRSTGGHIDDAITYLMTHKEERSTARKRARKERELINAQATTESYNSWINPRSLNNLLEMGFAKNVAIVALKKTQNDISQAISLLQTNYDQLLSEVPNEVTNKKSLIDGAVQMGFNEDIVKMVLQTLQNTTADKLIEKLLDMQGDGTYFTAQIPSSSESSSSSSSSDGGRTDETLSSSDRDTDSDKQKSANQIKAKEAFVRFSEGVSREADAYLDLPLVQEEMILNEYKKYLAM